MLRPALLAALLLAAFPGCLEEPKSEGDPDGHYVYFSWGRSQRQCTNGDCTYGTNAMAFSKELACDVAPTLSWDANSWIHGSVTVRVKDSTGAQVATHSVTASGKGSMVVQGEAGTWTFEGTTSNANGNMQYRLTCQ